MKELGNFEFFFARIAITKTCNECILKESNVHNHKCPCFTVTNVQWMHLFQKHLQKFIRRSNKGKMMPRDVVEGLFMLKNQIEI